VDTLETLIGTSSDTASTATVFGQIQKIQDEVDKWINQYKIGYWKPHEILARLTEETGELAREINHIYGPKKKKLSEETKNLSDEIADIIFTLS
jgi:NTP pyrophosphatase (non-canonical NTP hydrolase)